MKLFSLIMVAILLFSPGGLLAGSLPSGYKVVKGKVTVTVDGKVMDIDQATQKAIVNWQKFGIDEGYTVNVNQINSTAAMLARVIGNDPSNILGNLNATGHFYLVNQNGVYFGPNSRVDVGAIIASTMDILDDDFMAGNLNFFGEAKGSVINAGQINADAVALIGKDVQNLGTINANQVGLIAAQKAVTLNDFGGGSKLVVDFSDFNKAEDVAAPTTVTNAGTINAGDDGDVVLFAEAGEADNENGTIIANTAEISGAIVDLTKLGTVKANDLLIDPEGKLLLLGEDVEEWPLHHMGADVNGVIWTNWGVKTMSDWLDTLDASHITLSYDGFELYNNVSITSTKGLTLRTNDADGSFNSNGNTIETAGDLTLDAGTFDGALTISADNGSVKIIARADDADVNVDSVFGKNGVLIDADIVNFINGEAEVVNTTVFNAYAINLTANSADIKIDGDANDPLGSTTVNVFSAADGIAINKVNIGQLDIIAGEAGEGDLLLNGVKAVDDLSVTAATLDVNGVVTAAGIEMTADTINLDFAAITANQGNVEFTAPEINVEGDNVITARQDAIFNGVISGDDLTIKADGKGIAFNDT
ncbi:MAG: filamentous hemagglutinin N-terminal domain-containing protein, partial [Victivallales bacterium]|nr:filamentous hemagglutinin N-terminal domain-containing protein [Victivallales bacterium]